MTRLTVSAALIFCLCLLSQAIAQSSATGSTGPGVYALDSLLDLYPLEKSRAVRSDVIAWDSASSVHLTQVEGAIDLHRHFSHDENIWIVRGACRLTLGDQKIKVKAGQIVHIPRGTPHAFHSLGSKPAVLISVFSPGFDGKDRIFVDQSEK